MFSPKINEGNNSVPTTTTSYGAIVTPEAVVIDGREDEAPLIYADQIVDLSNDDEDDKPGGQQGDDNDGRPVYHDVAFSIIFYIHLAIMVFLAAKFGSFGPPDDVEIDLNVTHWRSFVEDDQSDMTDDQWKQLQMVIYDVRDYMEVYPQRIVCYLVLPISVVAFAVGLIANTCVIPACPRTMVQTSLLSSFGWTVLLAVFITLSASTWLGYVFSAAIVVIVGYYIRVVWPMIPFASVNLEVALKGINANGGMYVIAVLFSILAFVWNLFWLYTVMGVLAYREIEYAENHPEEFSDNDDGNEDGISPEGGEDVWAGLELVLFLISLYWTNTVLLNTTQVTIAGVMGTWCYVKDEARSCCSPAVTNSLGRSVSYSFGSICMGSLLQTLVTVLRQMLENARRNRQDANQGSTLCLCILECITKCFEDLISYFNQWAYVYVGIYGFSYIESGKRVFELFKARGFTSFITNDLVGYVLGFTTASVGFVTGLLAVLLEFIISCSNVVVVVDDKNDGNDDKASFLFGPVPGAGWWAFVIGFLLGVGICGVMMNVVKGAVNSLIVCYADGPAKLEENHPEETRKMANAWVAFSTSTTTRSNSEAWSGDRRRTTTTRTGYTLDV